MFCRNCGSEIPDNVKYCSHCGFSLYAETEIVVKPHEIIEEKTLLSKAKINVMLIDAIAIFIFQLFYSVSYHDNDFLSILGFSRSFVSTFNIVMTLFASIMLICLSALLRKRKLFKKFFEFTLITLVLLFIVLIFSNGVIDAYNIFVSPMNNQFNIFLILKIACGIRCIITIFELLKTNKQANIKI
jgi:asparagine N-glycosylation enzyme membrane subunit Stt3